MAATSHTAAVDDGEDEVRFRRYCFCSGPERGTHTFSARLIHLGSAPDNDLVVDSPTVSRQHARLEFNGSGYVLRDLGSKNGTFVDGVRITEAFVVAGSRVRLGTAEMEFRLEDETVQVALSRAECYGQLIGRSSQMREIFALLAKIAPTRATVLVEGESGTGKELVADAIHSHSPRAAAPLVVFDCSAVAPELIESELFGHVKGAFTGAVAARKGVFEQAHGGTLFLDEVGELPLELQPKLLRVLESGQVRPVGSGEQRRTDVRVVAATNRNLEREIESGQFREDLYYRLAVIKVRLPALRLRPEDIPLLVKHFLADSGSEGVHVGFETMQRLQQHPWQGNVRELKNYVERAVVLADSGRLETRFLTDRGLAARESAEAADHRESVDADYELPFKDAKARLLDTFERRYWLRLLEETEGNVSEAARRGGIHRKSLEYLMKKLDLRGDVHEDL
ncbi:MAG: sigma 54-interacting transcriptional regulator [Myxococcota bacterium]